MQKFYIVILFQLLVCCDANSQEPLNKDSLLQLLPSVKEDSAGVDFYISLGQQFENNDPELAKRYYRTAKEISNKINYPNGFIKYVNNYTYVLNLQGRYDSSLQLNLEGVAMARHINDSLSLAKTLINTGTSYRNLFRMEEAIQYYEEGKKIMEKYMNDEMAARIADILQILYKDLKQYDKAIAYGKTATDYFRKSGNKLLLAFSLSNLALSYVKKQDYQQGLKYFSESLAIGETLKDTTVISATLLNLGDLYMKLGEYEKMEPFFRKAYLLTEKIDALEQKVILLRALSLVEISKQNYIKAKEYAEQSLTLAKLNGFYYEQQKTLETLSNIHYAMHDMRSAEKYQQQASIISDSLLNETVTKNIIATEKKFETEKKEFRISQLESEKELQRLAIKQKNIFNIVLIGGLTALLVIMLLLFRNYNNKQKLQMQRISELETEKQLAATESVLKGEEQERTRLAKDLHDGLGGMLSGIKYSFQTMKGNLIMTQDNQQAFERSMDMLDSSIKEMRRVAHNLMPEVLVRYGLQAALMDYIAEINKSGIIKIVSQSIGKENRNFNQTMAFSLYRIVQELINNAIKHSGAAEVLVQTFWEPEKLIINVEDNGKGFDISILNNAEGIGWKNIRSRVDFLKGAIDIHSTPGKGTFVNLEFITS